MASKNSEDELRRSRRFSEISGRIKTTKIAIPVFAVLGLALCAYEYESAGSTRYLWTPFFIMILGVFGGLARLRKLKSELRLGEEA
jgi:hypothetical protein